MVGGTNDAEHVTVFRIPWLEFREEKCKLTYYRFQKHVLTLRSVHSSPANDDIWVGLDLCIFFKKKQINVDQDFSFKTYQISDIITGSIIKR
jgi:hypothetical protein